MKLGEVERGARVLVLCTDGGRHRAIVIDHNRTFGETLLSFSNGFSEAPSTTEVDLVTPAAAVEAEADTGY